MMLRPHRSFFSLALLLVALLAAACSQANRAEKLHEQGMLLMQHRKYFPAIAKFEEALKLEPNRSETLLAAADAYLQTRRSPERAILYAQRALDHDPKLVDAYLKLGQSHLMLAVDQGKVDDDGHVTPDPKELAAAEQIASRLRQDNPDSLEGDLLQGRLDVLNGRIADAEKLFRAALKKSPYDPTAQVGLVDVLLGERRYPDAVTTVKLFVAGKSNPLPVSVRQYAMALAMTGQFDDAYTVMDPYVGKVTVDSDLQDYLVAGNVLVAQIDSLLRSSDDGSSVTAALSPVAVPGAVSGAPQPAPTAGANPPELAAAIKKLDTVSLNMKSGFGGRPEPYYFRGLAFQLNNNLDNAVQNLQQAVARAPKSRDYRLALALAYQQGRNYALARQELTNLLRDHPGDYEARLRMAQCFASEGTYDSARDLLTRLRLEKPGDALAKELMGRIMVLSANPQDVEQGLALLTDAAGPAGLRPGAQSFVRGQSEFQAAIASERAGRESDTIKHVTQAESDFRDSLKADPHNYLAGLKLSELALRRGDLFGALSNAQLASHINAQFRPLEASLFAQLGQPDAAAGIYRQLLKENPKAVGFDLALANIKESSLPLTDAQQMYEDLGKKYPDSPQPAIREAQLLDRHNEPAKAAQLLADASAKFPGDLDLLLSQAQLLMRGGEAPKAVEPLGKVAAALQERASVPSSSSATNPRQTSGKRVLAPVYLDLALANLLAGNPEQAFTQAQMAADASSEAAAVAMIDEALARLAENKPADATQLLTDLTAKQVNLPPDVPLLLALAQLAQGRQAEAHAALESGKALNAQTVSLFEGMLQREPAAKLQAAAPRMALAIQVNSMQAYAPVALKQFSDLLVQMPGDPFLLARRAETYNILRRNDEALRDYEQIAQAMPDFAPAIMAQAALHMAIASATSDVAAARAHRDDAEKLSRMLLARDPKSTAAIQQLAGIKQLAGKLDEANDFYRQLIQIDPNNWSAYNNLAWNLAESNKVDEAATVGEKALTMAPKVGAIEDTVGLIELRRGQTARAIELLREACLRLPNNPDIRYHLAQALEKQGRKDDAADVLRAIVLATPRYNQIDSVKADLARLAPDDAAKANGSTSPTLKRVTGAQP